MMRWLVVTVLMLGNLSALAAGQEAAKPIRLLAEAEDFQVEKGPWKTVPYRENYYASTFAITFLSRMACLGAPAQVDKDREAVATQKISLPAFRPIVAQRISLSEFPSERTV